MPPRHMMPRAYSVSVVRTFVRYYARMSVHTYVRDPIRLWFLSGKR